MLHLIETRLSTHQIQAKVLKNLRGYFVFGWRLLFFLSFLVVFIYLFYRSWSPYLGRYIFGSGSFYSDFLLILDLFYLYFIALLVSIPTMILTL